MGSPFLTNSGLSKLAVAAPETPMTVRWLVVDTGTGTPSTTMTSVFNEAYRTEIPNPTRDASNARNLIFTGTIPESVGGWSITGLGLVDGLGVLVAYWQLDEVIVKPDPSSALKMALSPDMIINLSNASQAELIVTSSTLFRHNAMTERSAVDAHPISSITGLNTRLSGIDQAVVDVQTDVNNKDAQNVKITGNQTIGGIKTFTAKATFSAGMVGNGSELTFLNGSEIKTGTIDVARLPVGSSSVKGVLQVGENISATNGVISVVDATASVKGAVKIGANISVTAGEISVPSSSGSTLGVVKQGDYVTISSGTINVNKASATAYGAVKIGANIVVSDGTISVPNAHGSAAGVVKEGTGISIANGVVSAKAIGVAQVWQTLTQTRSLGTAYTNNTDRAIQFFARSTRRTDTVQEFSFALNGNSWGTVAYIHDSYSSQLTFLSPLILPGQTYQLSANSGTVLDLWMELS